MKNKKSYSEIMKSRSNQTKSSKSNFMLDLYIRMIFDEAILLNKKYALEEKINEAIDTKNIPLFMELSVEYKNLIQSIS